MTFPLSDSLQPARAGGGRRANKTAGNGRGGGGGGVRTRGCSRICYAHRATSMVQASSGSK